MSVAQDRDLYEQFEPKEDSLFFRIGEGEVICFHGRNCHIRKRISGKQRELLITDDSFVRVSTDCYVNIKGITQVEDDSVYFEEKLYGNKRIPISKRVREEILKRMQRQGQMAN